MDNVMISIVLPAYNAEKYIDNSVNSVINQTYKNWELIIVENGSTDNTTKKCLKYLTDERIKLVHSSKGVSEARNKGIETAKGEWLVFLDADDVLLENSLEILISCADKNIQLIVGDYDFIKSNNSYKVITNNKSFLKSCFKNPTIRCKVTGNMYYLPFIIDKGILFDTKLIFAEDSEFMIKVILEASRIIKLNKQVYHYTYSEESTVRSKKNKKYIECFKDAIKKIKKLLARENKDVKAAFDVFIINQLLVITVNYIFKDINNYKEYRQACKLLDDLRKDNIFGFTLKRIDLNELSIEKRICTFCLKYKLFCFVYFATLYKHWINHRRNRC